MPFQIPPAAESHCKFRLWKCLRLAEGGSGGGTVIATGTPEEVAASPVSYTGRYRAQMLGIERTEQTMLE